MNDNLFQCTFNDANQPGLQWLQKSITHITLRDINLVKLKYSVYLS